MAVNDKQAATSGYATLNNAPVFKHVDSIYTDRLGQFIDANGGYKDFNLPKFYEKGRIDNQKGADASKGYINLQTYSVPGLGKPLFRDLIPLLSDDDWKDTSKGASFGPSWTTHWFKAAARVPADWLNAEQVLLDWDSNNEALIYTEDGEPLQSFSGGGERTEFILPKLWYEDGKEFRFYIEAVCNGMFGNGPGTVDPPDPNRYFGLSKADLFVPNLAARALHIDFWEIADSAREMPGDSWQKHKARAVANEIMNAFDPEDESSIEKAQQIAYTYVGASAHSHKVFEEGDLSKIDVYGISNTHIDTAWLWNFSCTRGKVIRSWNTQIDLLNRYPETRFVASQAQQFHWIKHDSPQSFSKIKQKVAEGRFIPIGGSWVENDTNMPSGESLGRQFLKGQTLFRHNFGLQSDTFWLPDTFGYSSQIPQLCRLSRMDRFLTQKLSWNNINLFPLTTFNWVALDGSQVLTHMPPANTYTADANWGDVRRSVTQHKNLAYDQKGLLLYGKGDGGGGSTPEQIEKLRRCRGISNTVGELPTVHQGYTVKQFFDSVLKNTANGAKLPSWNGELYFEFHRGTYTTQAKMKKLVRWAEFNLRDLEYAATVASLFKKSYEYPKRDLARFWENVLLCQFHDVLPGSCIEMVYKDARPMLSHVVHDSYALTHNALRVLGVESLVHDAVRRRYSHESYVTLADLAEGDFCIVNSSGLPRSEVVRIPRITTLVGCETHERNKVYEKVAKFVQKGRKCDYVYVSSEKTGNDHLLAPVTTHIKHPAALSESDSHFVLENGVLRVAIDKKSGVISSIVDLRLNKEVLDTKTGANKTGANQFVLLEDTPLGWPAWDTELFSLEKIKPLEAKSVSKYENGALKCSVKVVVDIPANSNTSEASRIVSVISLAGVNSSDDLSYVEVENKVDWHEKNRFLKVEFPVDIHSEYTSYETQFGVTKRPTHYNTSWDVAKFEVCHHKFADYSEYNYGVTILNDAKYGFSTHGNLMRLSLLRAPKGPDAHADMGTHFFRYGIYPHKGGLNLDVVRLGYHFNNKLFHNSLDKAGNSDEASNQFYELQKVENGDGLPDVELVEKAFGTNLVVNKPNEFSEDFFDFITVKGDNNLVLSNIKRYENDEDVFVNYANDVRSDIDQMVAEIINHQQSTLSINTSNTRDVAKVSSKIKNNASKTKSVVVRIYEALGGKGTTTLHVKKLLTLKKVVKVNNLEEDLEELQFASSNDDLYYTANIGLRSFEIAGFRLEFEV